MKNVIVLALGGARYAVELRWVREVTKLGPITPVPGSPDTIAGVVNCRGAIVPVLALPELADSRTPRAGDAAILIEVEGTRAALCIDIVHSVCTLDDAEDGSGLVNPAGGESIPLLNPPALIRDGTASTPATATEVG